MIKQQIRNQAANYEIFCKNISQNTVSLLLQKYK